jgi:hypothetical protein
MLIALLFAAPGLAVADSGAVPISVAGAPACISVVGQDSTQMNLAPPVLAEGVTAERTIGFLDPKFSTFSIVRTHRPPQVLTTVTASNGQLFVTKAGNRIKVGSLTLRVTLNGSPLATVASGNPGWGHHTANGADANAISDALAAGSGKVGLSYADASGSELLRFEFDTAEFSSVMKDCKPKN